MQKAKNKEINSNKNLSEGSIKQAISGIKKAYHNFDEAVYENAVKNATAPQLKAYLHPDTNRFLHGEGAVLQVVRRLVQNIVAAIEKITGYKPSKEFTGTKSALGYLENVGSTSVFGALGGLAAYSAGYDHGGIEFAQAVQFIVIYSAFIGHTQGV